MHFVRQELTENPNPQKSERQLQLISDPTTIPPRPSSTLLEVSRFPFRVRSSVAQYIVENRFPAGHAGIFSSNTAELIQFVESRITANMSEDGASEVQVESGSFNVLPKEVEAELGECLGYNIQTGCGHGVGRGN